MRTQDSDGTLERHTDTQTHKTLERESCSLRSIFRSSQPRRRLLAEKRHLLLFTAHSTCQTKRVPQCRAGHHRRAPAGERRRRRAETSSRQRARSAAPPQTTDLRSYSWSRARFESVAAMTMTTSRADRRAVVAQGWQPAWHGARYPTPNVPHLPPDHSARPRPVFAGVRASGTPRPRPRRGGWLHRQRVRHALARGPARWAGGSAGQPCSLPGAEDVYNCTGVGLQRGTMLKACRSASGCSIRRAASRTSLTSRRTRFSRWSGRARSCASHPFNEYCS